VSPSRSRAFGRLERRPVAARLHSGNSVLLTGRRRSGRMP
jgi:hypothetical protein